MRRVLFAALCAAALASPAHAATLTIVSDKSAYAFGETITLTITGDAAGATAYGIFGELIYSGAQVDNGTRTQTQLVGQYGKWTTGVLNQFDDGINAASYAFSQISGTYAQTANNLPGTLAIVTLINGSTGGVLNVAWDTTNPNPALRLDFFGLTSAPGTSFYLGPEPGTAGLLGLGLLALGAARRHRDARQVR
jgi:opacity protein-like surface antigen